LDKGEEVENNIFRSGKVSARLNLNGILFSFNFPKSKLLCFPSIVQTSNNQNCTTYTLIDSGMSHSFIDICFIRSLGLIPRISGTMVVSTLPLLSHKQTDRQTGNVTAHTPTLDSHPRTTRPEKALLSLRGGKNISAGSKSDILPCHQVYISAAMKGITRNKFPISGWLTLFNLRGAYDLIIGKDWMSSNTHMINHSTNILHLL
jgi:hypothetical protein